jgi:hypothetical protein
VLSTNIPAGAASGTFSLIADNLVVNNRSRLPCWRQPGSSPPGRPHNRHHHYRDAALSFTFSLSGPPGTQVEIIPSQPLDQPPSSITAPPWMRRFNPMAHCWLSRRVLRHLNCTERPGGLWQPAFSHPIIITTEPPPPPTSTLILWYQIDTG